MNHHRSSRRRFTVAVLAVFAVFAVFAVRLADIQLVRADELSAAAAEKRVIPVTTHGVRGDIVDANGVVLADSVERYDITASPKNVQPEGFDRIIDGKRVTVPLMDAIAELAKLTGQTPKQIYAILRKDPDADFTYIVKGVKLETYEKIKALDIPWVYFELRPSRTYPNGAVAGNLIGFLGTDAPQAGTELKQDACLAASDGSATFEVSQDGVQLPGSRVVETEAKDGGTIHLTIDSNLNYYAQQVLAEEGTKLGADWATAMVVEVETGQIKAAADWPTVDPNDRNSVDRYSLGARSFASPYEPGSTIKAATIASLLDAGVISADTQVIAPGRYTKGLPAGSYIKDAWAHDDIRYTTAGVLANSSNTGIAVLTERLSAERRHAYLDAFGIGHRTAVDFLGESSGTLIPVNQLDSITNITQQFGQGMTATSAQVASIYQTLGNDGVRMPLSLIAGCERPDGTMTGTPSTDGTRVVSESAADTTVRMMESVVSEGLLGPILQIPGYRIGAKTGTAEVATSAGYGADRIVSVAGLVPAEDPKYAIVVTFAKPDTVKTSAAAAPGFNAIMEQTIKTFRITPSTQQATPLPLVW